MAHSRLPRPASLQCHFLAVGEFAPVDLRVASLGGSKRAESLRVEVTQTDRLLLVASVWMTDDALSGYVHDFAAAPALPRPDELRGYQSDTPRVPILHWLAIDVYRNFRGAVLALWP
jgi:acyl-CoA thioesterase II